MIILGNKLCVYREEGIAMKIVICDDEQPYAEAVALNVRCYMDSHHIRHSIHIYTDSSSVFEQGQKYDMAFLDIEMGTVSGIELAKSLKKRNPKIIIFMITSHNQYLDAAMDLSVFRYIQKPLDVPRLFSGLDTALERLNQTTVPFYLHDKDDTVRIFSDDILYIEIVNRHTKVVTAKNEFLSNNSIDYWYSNLPKTSFYMVHSSFIINLRFVIKYTRDHVVLENNDTIPIAYRKQSSFKHFFSDYCSS